MLSGYQFNLRFSEGGNSYAFNAKRAVAAPATHANECKFRNSGAFDGKMKIQRM